MNKRYVSLLAICFCMLLAATAWPQVPNLEPEKQQESRVPVPIVSFDLAWINAQPAHFAIAVESTGNAAYRSDEAFENGKPLGDSYLMKFVVTEPTRSKIFDLAKETNYFKGNFDFTKSRIAKTGNKTLTYEEGNLNGNFNMPVQGAEHQTVYNWSENPAIQQLTRIFEGISTTIELGRKLDFDRRFDKLGLDAVLKRAEEMQKSGYLEQVQVIAPVLKNIVNDVSVMNIARERAKRMLAAATAQQNEQAAGPALDILKK